MEVLDADGRVVDVVSRHRMRSEGLAHRSTFVITVLDPRPPEHPLDPLQSDRVEEWLRSLSWPLLGPETDEEVRPALAPQVWGPEPSARLNEDTPLIVHRRADWKDVYPGYWDLAFGGVCSVGERWLESAERELAEEAGLPTRATAVGAGDRAVPVVPVAAGRYRDQRSETFGAIFVAFADREPEPADGEVVALDRIPLGDLAAWVHGRHVCPDSNAMVVPVVAQLLDSPDWSP